jgi:hypothetical protein
MLYAHSTVGFFFLLVNKMIWVSDSSYLVVFSSLSFFLFPDSYTASSQRHLFPKLLSFIWIHCTLYTNMASISRERIDCERRIRPRISPPGHHPLAYPRKGNTATISLLGLRLDSDALLELLASYYYLITSWFMLF